MGRENNFFVVVTISNRVCLKYASMPRLTIHDRISYLNQYSNCLQLNQAL